MRVYHILLIVASYVGRAGATKILISRLQYTAAILTRIRPSVLTTIHLLRKTFALSTEVRFFVIDM